ncbi:YidB family protein [Rhodopila sp.]|uniref:YidB family protein n=1 Tax=Rhodopila sp. TaxID=2480087 RepID=UPI003D0EAF43
MGILDTIMSSMGSGNASGEASPIQGILGSLLGGGQANQAGNQGMTGGAASLGGMGGLQGLISKFEGAGLGGIAQSWVGNGANQPVSPEQLHGVLGNDQVQAMSSQSGMAPQDFLSQLSQHLPNAVHAATPDGRLPDEGSVSV